MGKRKSSKKPVVRRQNEPLATTFKCLFCNHEKSVNVKIDKASMFGHLSCKVCGQKFTTPINNLSAAVDVYCDWVDACDEVRAKAPPKKAKPPPKPRSPSPVAAKVSQAYVEDDDDDDDADLATQLGLPPKRKAARDYDDEDDDEDDGRRSKHARRVYEDDDDDDED